MASHWDSSFIIPAPVPTFPRETLPVHTFPGIPSLAIAHGFFY
jgi:hypothetical protein